MKTGVPNHTKTLRLARRMRCSRALVVGILTLLWDLARRECKDGYLSGITPEDLAAHFGMDLDEGTRTVGFLIECGWLDVHPSGDGWLIHDWFDHCEWYVIRDLIIAGLLPDGWERGDLVPERPLSLNKSEQVATRCNKSPSCEGKGKGKGKSSEGTAKGDQGLWFGIEIPPTIDMPDFRSAMVDWEQHRSVRGKKTWTQLAATKCMNKLDRMGAARAVAAIDNSIAGGYQGLYEGGGQNQNNQAGADLTKLGASA